MARQRQNVSAAPSERLVSKRKSNTRSKQKQTQPTTTSTKFLSRYSTLLVILLTVYTLPLVLLYAVPSLQAQIIFMPVVSWPPFLNLTDPSSVGLQGARNFYITSENSIKIGVWHILPKSLRNANIKNAADFDRALSAKPIMMYVHGNAGTRGGYHRVELCKLLSDLDYNVIAFDYRGFGDSTNERPTARGLVADSKSIYHWITSKVASHHKVFVWGHSMGTAVVSRFVSELAVSGELPTGVVLESGFNNVKSGILNYPLARLFNFWPFFEHILDHVIKTQDLDFVSEQRVKGIKSPLLMLHAADDNTVKIHLGRLLKDAAESSRSNNLYFKYVEYDAKHHYGHKYIFTDPHLPKLISDFVELASSS